MYFSADDVVRNIRHFLSSVKRVTGNAKDEGRRAKNAGAKPGEPQAIVYDVDVSLNSVQLQPLAKLCSAQVKDRVYESQIGRNLGRGQTRWQERYICD